MNIEKQTIASKEQADKLIEKLKGFSPKLEFNRWITDEKNWLAYYDDVKSKIYEFSCTGKYYEFDLTDEDPNEYKDNRYATEDEILKALSKEAIRIGSNKDSRFYYSIRFNSLTIDNCIVFSDGIWIKPTEEPKTEEPAKENIDFTLEERVQDLEKKLSRIIEIKD
jgi:hypothetical protein